MIEMNLFILQQINVIFVDLMATTDDDNQDIDCIATYCVY